MSFVRSLGLDRWTIEQMDVMERGGNDLLRQFISERGIRRVDYSDRELVRFKEKLTGKYQ